MTALRDVLSFIQELRARKLHFSIDVARVDAIMVTVAVPGELWEVEFFEDGSVEVERYKSDGTIFGRESLTELYAFADDQPTR
jgi:hypothetical protein